jgi:hypothetical protein
VLVKEALALTGATNPPERGMEPCLWAAKWANPVTPRLPELLRGCAVAARQKAGTTEDRAALRRVERDGRLLAALSAVDRDFDPLADAGSLGGSDGSEALVFGLLAWFAPLRLVLQTFVVKEDLLAARPDEVVAAVDTLDRAVFKFHLCLTPLPV